MCAVQKKSVSVRTTSNIHFVFSLNCILAFIIIL